MIEDDNKIASFVMNGLKQVMVRRFDPAQVLRLIQEEVKRSLNRWEPRITLDDVRVETSPNDARAVNITIYYTLVATQRHEQLNLTLALQA